MKNCIRRYTEADINQVIDIWYKASKLAHPFLSSTFLKLEEKKIREIYIPDTSTWVYDSGTDLDGFISMMDNEVGAIFVKPEKHGQGIGRALMDHVRSMHRELEVEVFEGNAIGRSFYDKYGFKIVGEGVHEETGQNALRMKLSS